MLAKMRNMGEACTSANRFHVAAPVAADFVDRLAARMASLKVGRGTEPDVQVGPLIDSVARAKVAELGEDATRAGARVVVGGEPSPGPGYFFPPTVLTDVPAGAKIACREAFGPVVGINPEYVLVCKATDELSTSGTLRDETLRELLDQYGETISRKIVLMIAWFNLLSRFLNGCRVPLETTDKIGTGTSPLENRTP